METDREKWNRRYSSQDSYLGRAPSPFLKRMINQVESLVRGRKALDIACGEGRNSLFLAERGFQVTALDISDTGLEKGAQQATDRGLAIDFRRVDLDRQALTGCYDLVINFNFLIRGLIPAEIAVLNPGGVLLFDTIMETPALLLSHTPSYLLRPGELEQLFAGYDGDMVFHEESDNGEMPTARVMFRKAGPH